MGTRLFVPRSPADAATGASSDAPEAPAGFRRGLEALALLLFAVALYLGLALASLELDPHDPSVGGANWVGPVGARVAEVLAAAFGVIAWTIPLELVLLGLPMLRRRESNLSPLRISGDLVVAIVASALVQVVIPNGRVFGELRAGGNVGLLFGEFLSALFSTAGSLLVGTTVIGLILIGRAQFSFIELCRRIVEFSRRAFDGSVAAFRRVRAAWTEASRLRREQRETEKLAGRPKIDSQPGDEAFIAHVEDSDTWIPLERTGAPPLALADSLRGIAQGTLPQSVLDLPSPAPPEVQAAPSEVSEDNVSEDGHDESTSPADETQAADADETSTDAKSKRASAETVDEARAGETSLTIVDTRRFAEVERGRPRRSRSAGKFVLPDTSLLEPPAAEIVSVDKERVRKLAERLERTLADYGVTGKVDEVHPGPTVTTYEVSPEAGTKVSKVAGLSDDLALGLSRKVRIIAPIPGKARIGFELPNDERVPVNLRELIEDQRFQKLAAKAPLPVVLGRDIVGAPFYADLASMPHVIVAGATGAGKSVGLNVMLSSLLFQRTPDELRMLMIDPKVVELAPFDGIPHMLLPVVTDMKQAAKALKWAVDEMEKRYQAFALAGTKNITTYNLWIDRIHRGEIAAPSPQEVEALTVDGGVVSVPAAKTGTDGAPLPGRMPHIVVVVDEFADLMMQQGKEVEASVARLAQKARAAGMHVVLATQRPSVDVITGMIKANFPTRIAFRVAQKVDSRTILDEQGAELLLGKGDMLVKLNGSTETHRVQCPFVSEEEVSQLTDHLRAQGSPEYFDDILRGGDEESNDVAEEALDPRFDEAVRVVADTQRCSTSWLQRKLTIGYNRAAKIVEMMEARGIVGPANGSKEREIFVHPQ